jgi:AMP deaminase
VNSDSGTAFDNEPDNLRHVDKDAGIMEEDRPEDNKNDVKNKLDSQITEELRMLCTNFQKCLELRDKYMKVSSQRVGDNPSDSDEWTIYPPPPVPSWPPSKPEDVGRVTDGPDSIGSDFVREEMPIPGLCDHFFEMDDTSVYQVRGKTVIIIVVVIAVLLHVIALLRNGSKHFVAFSFMCEQ